MSDLSPGFDLPPGTRVGEYEVQGVVGRGGMGTVYAAVHPRIHKRAAIKVINAPLSGSEEACARFLQEAQVVNRVGHPGLVDIFFFSQLADGRPYLVMEFLEGEPLSERMARGPLRFAELHEIFSQVLDSLGAAHETGVVHRDLKPENIFLCPARDGMRTKLLDFGLAKDLESGGARVVTRTGITMGTPVYMSPEQCRGRDVDHRTDLYALGIVLYEAVAGRAPFLSESVLDLLNQHLSEPPPPPSRFAVLPEGLEEVVLRALAKQPGERFQSAAEMQAALRVVAGDDPGARVLSRRPSGEITPAAVQPTDEALPVVSGAGLTSTEAADVETTAQEAPAMASAVASGVASGGMGAAAVPPGAGGLVSGGTGAVPVPLLRSRRPWWVVAIGAALLLLSGITVGSWLRPGGPARGRKGEIPARPVAPTPTPTMLRAQPAPPPEVPSRPIPVPQAATVEAQPLSPTGPAGAGSPAAGPAAEGPAAGGTAAAGSRPGPRPAPRPIKRNGSLVVLTGRADAEVWVDSRPRGRGKIIQVAALAPGAHRVAVGAPQCQDVLIDAHIRAGQEQRLVVTLQRRASPPVRGGQRRR